MRSLLLSIAGCTALVATSAAAAPVVSLSFETGLQDGSIQYGLNQSNAHGTDPGGPPVVIPNVTFKGYSGVITNGAAGVFDNAPDGNTAGFGQAFDGTGSGQIDWAISGLTYGKEYRFSCSGAGAKIVPTAPVTVSGPGLTSTTFTPGTAYTPYSLLFVANGTSGVISLSTPAGQTTWRRRSIRCRSRRCRNLRPGRC